MLKYTNSFVLKCFPRFFSVIRSSSITYPNRQHREMVLNVPQYEHLNMEMKLEFAASVIFVSVPSIQRVLVKELNKKKLKTIDISYGAF